MVKFWKAVICFFMAGCAPLAFGQKVKVGYDKGTDFSKFKSYTWTQPSTLPSFPALYAAVVAQIDGDLKAKGFNRVEKDGDLLLGIAGGVDMGISAGGEAPFTSDLRQAPPTSDATMWTGTGGGMLAPPIGKGTLRLEFVERGANKMIWSGSVSQKLDPNKRQKTLESVGNAIDKLLQQFPPKQGSK